jgi:cell division protein FtsX
MGEMRYFRNLGRRPVRTVLTILGITIGIWALVVFGSMANKINALVSGGSDYYADKITLSDRCRCRSSKRSERSRAWTS